MNESAVTTRSPSIQMILRRWLRSFLFYYPLTLAGSLLLAAALFLLGRSLAQENPYGVLLALAGLLVLSALSVTARLQANRYRRRQVHWHWDSSVPLYARRTGLNQGLVTEALRTLPFFRVHFALKGTLKVGRKASLRIQREISFAEGTRHPVELYFPLCGPFACTGRFAVRDIFGLSRARFGETLLRKLTVQPASFAQKSIPVPEPSVGFEETSRKRSSDEEKYYMREYLPGDRFRDINWKVSSRLDELITRISPVTQEKTTILPVVLRNFRDRETETLESIVHLNVIKSWLMAFLRVMKQEHPEMQFRITSPSGSWLLQSDEDIERFGWELPGIFFQREAGSMFQAPAEEELFIFSTAFDRGLPAFLAAQAQVRQYIFRTAVAEEGQEQERTPLVLFQGSCACLPGSWILRREPGLKTPRVASPAFGRLEEEALSVRVL
ncbi:MAG: DUF58 domain-containing protein [Spirochaetaceae bacterium]|nr:MAG: DUF58 domain-containing protein [Spirochaetaceae bacterium]